MWIFFKVDTHMVECIFLRISCAHKHHGHQVKQKILSHLSPLHFLWLCPIFQFSCNKENLNIFSVSVYTPRSGCIVSVWDWIHSYSTCFPSDMHVHTYKNHNFVGMVLWLLLCFGYCVYFSSSDTYVFELNLSMCLKPLPNTLPWRSSKPSSQL